MSESMIKDLVAFLDRKYKAEANNGVPSIKLDEVLKKQIDQVFKFNDEDYKLLYKILMATIMPEEVPKYLENKNLIRILKQFRSIFDHDGSRFTISAINVRLCAIYEKMEHTQFITIHNIQSLFETFKDILVISPEIENFLSVVGFNYDDMKIYDHVDKISKIPKGIPSFSTVYNNIRLKCMRDKISMKSKREGLNFVIYYCPICNYHIIEEYLIEDVILPTPRKNRSRYEEMQSSTENESETEENNELEN